VARDPDSIQQEIDKARDALADTLDELSVKASPKRAVDGAKTSLRETLQQPKVRAALIGAGGLVGLVVLIKVLR
jgi:hypothetical protein